MSQAAVKAEPIGGAATRVYEVLKVCVVIDAQAQRDIEPALRWQLLGIYEDKAAGEVGGILRRRALDHYDIVELRAGDDVKGEGARVGLGAGHGATVEPHIIITLRQSAHHHKLLVDDRDAGHAAYHLRRIFVLCARYQLCRDAALHHEAAALGVDLRHLAVATRCRGHRHLVERLARGLQRKVNCHIGVALNSDLLEHVIIAQILDLYAIFASRQ